MQRFHLSIAAADHAGRRARIGRIDIHEALEGLDGISVSRVGCIYSLASCVADAGSADASWGGSGKWQAARWSAPNGRNGGSSTPQRSCARGQRG